MLQSAAVNVIIVELLLGRYSMLYHFILGIWVNKQDIEVCFIVWLFLENKAYILVQHNTSVQLEIFGHLLDETILSFHAYGKDIKTFGVCTYLASVVQNNGKPSH